MFTCLSPCKLNLFLYITGKRPDGYHNLQTLFVLLDYGDDMTFEPNPEGLRLEGEFDCPITDNLIYRAHALLEHHCRRQLPIAISVNKRIPAGAGLGGGSSNAATTLLVLNRIFNLGLSTAKLQSLGLSLGADVPFFIGGTCAYAAGIGEQLLPITLNVQDYVVAVPRTAISTPDIYRDPLLPRNAPLRSLNELLHEPFGNVMQDVVVKRHPEVGQVLAQLLKYGEARMSGSGGACFLICPNHEQAVAALAQLAALDVVCFTAKSVNNSHVTQALQQLEMHGAIC